MSIPKLKKQFLEVSDALELGNPSITEKDYWVVSLLAMLENVESEHHQLVFSGGTALAKSNIKITIKTNIYIFIKYNVNDSTHAFRIVFC